MKINHLLVPITLIGLSMGMSAQDADSVSKLRAEEKVQVPVSDESAEKADYEKKVAAEKAAEAEAASSEEREKADYEKKVAAEKAAEAEAASSEEREKADYEKKVAVEKAAEAEAASSEEREKADYEQKVAVEKAAEAEAASSQEREKADYEQKVAAEKAAQAETAKRKEREQADNDKKVAAEKISPVQSAARPFKLDITDKVQVAGSDEASKIFQSEVLPGMLKLVEKNLNEYQKLSAKKISALAIDPSRLALSSDTEARVYFVGEGAGFHNTLGISTLGNGPFSKDAELIFPDASSSYGFKGSGKGVRTNYEPLLPGDFVDLGTFKKGSVLDFFLIADGANGGENFYSMNTSLNKDGIVHAVSLAPEGSPYLIISFEDLFGGGDRDYNDLVFAVYLGENNIANLAGLGAPEPTLAAGALLTMGAIFGRRRRR